MLKRAHYRALKRAVAEAACWRGTLVGDPDPSGLEEFDAFIRKAKKALKKIKPLVPEKTLLG